MSIKWRTEQTGTKACFIGCVYTKRFLQSGMKLQPRVNGFFIVKPGFELFFSSDLRAWVSRLTLPNLL